MEVTVESRPQLWCVWVASQVHHPCPYLQLMGFPPRASRLWPGCAKQTCSLASTSTPPLAYNQPGGVQTVTGAGQLHCSRESSLYARGCHYQWWNGWSFLKFAMVEDLINSPPFCSYPECRAGRRSGRTCRLRIWPAFIDREQLEHYEPSSGAGRGWPCTLKHSRSQPCRKSPSNGTLASLPFCWSWHLGLARHSPLD